jgi:hypothetical protein
MVVWEEHFLAFQTVSPAGQAGRGQAEQSNYQFKQSS